MARFSQGIAQQFSYINATKRVFNINTKNIIIILYKHRHNK